MSTNKYIAALAAILLTVSFAAAQGQDKRAGSLHLENTADNLITSATYAFTAASGAALEDMSSGTSLLLPALNDDGNSPLKDIGFTFRFDGSNYTNFSATANGALQLGQLWAGQNSTNQINHLTHPKIMPYWDQICIGSNGVMHYKTAGLPGSRKLVIEWKNMKLTRGLGCDGEAGATFQVWLFEQTGVIQFVYGAGMTQVDTAGGYTVGIHKGASTNFASVTTATSSVSYTTANNSQTGSIAPGTSYTFVPPVPAAPAGGVVSNITRNALRVSWTDAASDETGYELRRSTDGVNYALVGTYPAGTTFADDSGLNPGTQYSYRVNAVSDGAFSSPLETSAATSPYGIVKSTAAGGSWSNPATWAGGVVPGIGDHVTIVGGTTVFIDATASAGRLTIGGAGNLAKEDNTGTEGSIPATLMFNGTTAVTLTVADDITILGGCSFTTGAENITQNLLSVGGDITNNGFFDLGTNGGLDGATIEFTGSESAIFKGSGPITDVYKIRVNKPAGVITELTANNFTAGDFTTDTSRSGYLTITSGIFKIGGTFTGTHRTFAAVDYSIPVAGGLWLNNPNYTVAGQEGSATVHGTLRISAGTYNVGLTPTANLTPIQTLRLREGSRTLIEGGSLNLTYALREDYTGGSQPLEYVQTGGTTTVCTKRNNAQLPCFQLVDSSFPTVAAISGGKIVAQNNGGFYTFSCFRCFTTDSPIVQFGNEFTEGALIFRSRGDIPNLVLNTNNGGHVLNLAPDFGSTTIGTANIGSPGAVDIQDQALNITGESIILNGFFAGNSQHSALVIKGANTVFSGTGGILSYLTALELRGQNFTYNTGGAFRVRYLRLVSGNLTGADRITMHTPDLNPTSITIGDPSGILTAGTLDATPNFELGMGGQTVRYLRTGPSRTTGPEINPTRQLSGLEFNPALQTDTLNIAGGELAVRDLTLPAGRVVATGANGIIHSGTLSGANGYIYGTLTRKFVNMVSYAYPIGLNSRLGPVFSPTSLHVNPTYVIVGTANGWMPGLLPSTSLAQNWTVAVNGDIGGRFVFPWAHSEVNGNESNYKLWQAVGGGQPQIIPFSLDAGSNSITMSNDTSALSGRWGVGEALDPGVSISGTVTNSVGMPIRNAAVRVTGGGLTAPVFVYTGNLGTYIVPGLLTSQTYTVTVGAKRYRFNPSNMDVTTTGNITGVNFTANPQE